MKMFEAGIRKAGGIEAAKLRPALEDREIESIKGKVFMRKCDHQGVQQGFIVKVVKQGDPHAGARGDRDLPGRPDDARMQQDGVQGLSKTVIPSVAKRSRGTFLRPTFHERSLDCARASARLRLG